MRIETLPQTNSVVFIYLQFQPVASMMRIETHWCLALALRLQSIPASRQYDEDWNTFSPSCLFQIIINSSQSPVWWGLKLFYLLFINPFYLFIPASRQYDEDWNKLLRHVTYKVGPFQPVASMMRIETIMEKINEATNTIIPASRQYDEDWNNT